MTQNENIVEKELKKYHFNNILIVDGSYLLHRVLNVPNIYELCTSTGLKSGGIFKFLQSLIMEAKNSKKYPIVCWDAGLAARRTEADPNYKSNRDRSKMIIDYSDEKEFHRDEFLKQYKMQKAVLIEVLQNLNIPSLNISGWEGDDLMYILSRNAKTSILLSDDKDMIQALTQDIDVYRPMRKSHLKLHEYLNEAGFETIRQFVITKAIVGDQSDNIPKVADGVGEKGAKRLAKIIDENFENQAYLKVIEENEKKHDRAFLERHDRFLTNMELIDLSKIEITPEILSAIYDECNLRIVENAGLLLRAKEILELYEIRSLNLETFKAMLNVIKASVFVSEV